MMKDPIVCEVRNVGEELAREANYDVHKFVEIVNEKAKKYEKMIHK